MQVAITTFADPTDALFAATCLDAGRQPQPGGKVAGRLQLLAIANRIHKGRCRHGADARRGCRSLADLARLVPSKGGDYPMPDGPRVRDYLCDGLRVPPTTYSGAQ